MTRHHARGLTLAERYRLDATRALAMGDRQKQLESIRHARRIERRASAQARKAERQ